MKVTISGGSKGNSRVTTTINDVEKKQAVWATTENNNFNNEIRRHSIRIPRVVVVGTTISVDIAEVVRVVVIRRTAPPPHRRA